MYTFVTLCHHYDVSYSVSKAVRYGCHAVAMGLSQKQPGRFCSFFAGCMIDIDQGTKYNDKVHRNAINSNLAVKTVEKMCG